MISKISVVIPVYKNTDIFIDNLRNNIQFLANQEIIIVNDDPSQSIKKTIIGFKQIELLENIKNVGFAETVNRGINASHEDIIMILNSDVVLKDKSFLLGVEKFALNEKLFAIAFLQEEKSKQFVGKNKLFWKKGMIFHDRNSNLTTGATAWAEGGSSLFKKKMLKELGGLDGIYSPFYWEDIDLSYRAWKSGYEVLFDPNIRVIHKHETTIGSYFKKSFIKRTAFRNQFIFVWKNIRDPELMVNHVIYLPINIVYYLLKGEYNFFFGFIDALLLLFKGKIRSNKYNLKDSQILSKFL